MNKRFDLEGVMVKSIEKVQDERGFFAEVARKDWAELFGSEWISQANLSYSYPGMIRAWHRHARAQIDYFLVLKGALRIAIYDGDHASKSYSKLIEIVTGEHKTEIVRVPGHYWHGTKTIGDKPSLTLYFVNNLYDHDNPDEERKPWNDETIIDPRFNRPYNWDLPAHK